MKTHLLVVLFAWLLCGKANAQNNIYELLDAGLEDGEKYLGNYLAPFTRGVGYSLNNGWYNTAKAHKPLGFDLTVSANLAFVPAKDNYFSFKNSDYKSLRLASSATTAELPTVFGPDESTELEIYDNGNGQTALINSPGGLNLEEEVGFNAVPAAMLQLGIGIVKNTDIKLRYAPVFTDGFDMNLWGIGVMHDVKQWIPGMKHLPFDLAAFVGYTSVKASSSMGYNSPDVSSENQEAAYLVKGTTYQAIISKQFSVITFYGSLGYSTTKTNFKLKGNYIYTEPSTNMEVEIEDPFDLDFDDSSLRATAGFRLKLAIVTLHADYTFNSYNMVNAGIGFSVR